MASSLRCNSESSKELEEPIQVRQATHRVGFPAGVELATGSVFADIECSFHQMGIVMAVGVLPVYAVVVLRRRSREVPFISILSLPLASFGGLAASSSPCLP